MISMILIATSNSVNTYILSAVVFGLATGVSSPTLFAWTADLSHETRRGVGAGTMFIALEIGIILGSASTLIFYDNSKHTILISFLVGALLSFAAALFLVWHIRTKKSLY